VRALGVPFLGVASLRTLGPVLHAAQTRDTHLDTTHVNVVRMPLIALLLYFFRILPSGNESLWGISWCSFVIVELSWGLGMGLGANPFLIFV